jgi:hypothetical protein
MGVLYSRIDDGDCSATIEISILNENETIIQPLLDLSTLKGAVGPNYNCRVTKVFYSLKASPVQANDNGVITDSFCGLFWYTGGPVPDIFLVCPEGVHTINQVFKPSQNSTSANPYIYVREFTSVVLHVTIDKLEGFPLSTKKPKPRAF